MAKRGETTDERLEQVRAAVYEFGHQGAADRLEVTKATIRRHMREWRKRNGKSDESFDEGLLVQVRERFSDAEIKRLLNSQELQAFDTVQNSFEGDVLKVGGFTDPHLGSKCTDPDQIRRMNDVFYREKVDMVVCTGDVHEGMSNRPDHIYQCTHLGYSAQLDHSREIFRDFDYVPTYMIDGNHDRWYIKSNGAKIVDELCRGQENLHFIGHDEGNIEVGGITIKLWHGEDGNSYALSYRLQKIIESLSGGEKPNVLLTGHTHKSLTIFERNICTTSLGSIQKQSKWMRGKRISAHTGFYIITMHLNDTGVARYQPEWFPFYT